MHQNNIPAEITCTDAIDAGYRHFGAQRDKVDYPFGCDLSYSECAFSDLRLDVKQCLDKF